MNDEIREFAPSQQLIEIAEEFVQRVRNNETPTIEEYAERYPEARDEINRYLPMLLPSGTAGSASTAFRQLPIPMEQLPVGISRYHLRRLLGSGSMGAVYLARDLELERIVAFKIPQIPNTQSVERFYREARTMATVDHPHICSVFDVGEIRPDDVDGDELKDLVGRPFMTMAFVEGDDLSELITSPWDSRVAADLVRKLALGLHAAHQAGVVHRDVKPGNILINRDGEPVLTDFGLARRDLPDEVELTIDGQIIGSPAYMSPEQINCHPDLGPPADIYSLGVTLYELVCGQRPFSGSPLTLLRDICWKEPPSPKHFHEEVDSEIESICLHAIAKDPADRYATAGEFAADLDAYLQGNPIAAPRKRTNFAPVLPWLALVGCLVLAVFAWSRPTTRPKPTISPAEFRQELHEIFLGHFKHRAYRSREPNISAAYAAAFDKYGIRADTTSPQVLNTFLATQNDEVRNEILIGLESWFFCLQRKTEDVPAPWLRSVLESTHKDHNHIRKALLERNKVKTEHQIGIYQIEKHDPRLAVIWSLYLRGVRPNLYKQLLTATFEVYPDDLWVNTAFGIRGRNSDNPEAVRCLEKASQMQPSAALYTYLGAAHLSRKTKIKPKSDEDEEKQKEKEEAHLTAVDALMRAIELDAGYGAAHFNLGKAHFRHAEYELAKRSLETAIALDTNSMGQAHSFYARTLLFLNQESEALAESRNAIAIFRKNNNGLNIANLCNALLEEFESRSEGASLDGQCELATSGLQAARNLRNNRQKPKRHNDVRRNLRKHVVRLRTHLESIGESEESERFKKLLAMVPRPGK